MWNMIIQMIKQGILRKTDDSKNFPVGYCSSYGKAGVFVRVSPYGLDSNPPVDSHILLFNSQAQESNKFGICSDPNNRKKDLKDWEVALHNTKTKSWVYMKENGDIEIDAKNDVTINAAVNVNITAKDVNVTAENCTVEADAIKLGSSAAAEAMVLGTAFKDSYDAHTHSSSGAGVPTVLMDTPPGTHLSQKVTGE